MSHDINRKITQKTQSNDKFNMGTILTPAGFFNTQIKLHLKQTYRFRLVGFLKTTQGEEKNVDSSTCFLKIVKSQRHAVTKAF